MLVEIFVVSNADEILALHNATPYGLTASICPRSRARFESLGAGLTVCNL
jgi:acyl-CoA reductase-like NAD-dependent aldehyde dehydrogenase